MQANVKVNPNIIDRLLKFIDLNCKSVNAFHQSIGVSNGYVTQVKQIGSDIIEKIANVYPTLDIEWLITGNGNMLKDINNASNSMVSEGIAEYKVNQKTNEEALLFWKQKALQLSQENNDLLLKIDSLMSQLNERPLTHQQKIDEALLTLKNSGKNKNN
jgi:hypothetical protein